MNQIYECGSCESTGTVPELNHEERPQLPDGVFLCPKCRSDNIRVRYATPEETGGVPWDAAHTKRERERMRRRINRPPWNPNDPMYQAYGHPEGYR